MAQLALVGAPQLRPQSLPEAFRRIYYHLYSNSSASRAERLIANLSLLLLVKLAAEQDESTDALGSFLDGDGSANDLLLPLVRTHAGGVLGSGDSFSISDGAIRTALSELRHLRLSDAPAHVLGEAFQALMGPRLRGDRGQFFTPRSLVQAMVRIIDPQPSDDVLDPACGTGGFLAEAFAHMASRSAAANGRVVGIEKDHDLARLSSALLQVATRGTAQVWDRNSLTAETLTEVTGRFDVVLTNPPFGAKIGVAEETILGEYDFGHQWVDHRGRLRRTDALQGSQDPQILFVELCVRALRPGGRLGIVLPEGVFGNRNSAFVWQWLEERGEITALLDCPRTTFQPGTDTKTNVLFFRRAHQQPQGAGRRRVAVGVALECGHDRRGRASVDGRAISDDFALLAADYVQPKRNLWAFADLTESDYLVPRYHAGRKRPLNDPLLKSATWATLGDLVSDGYVDLRKGHEVGSEAYGTGDIPFVRTSDISNFEIDVDPTKSVAPEFYDRVAPLQRLVAGDVLMVVDGRYRIGAVAMLDEDSVRCIVQSHLRILGSKKPHELDPFALLFALARPAVRLRIRDLVFIQSTLGTLGARIAEIPIPVLVRDGPWAEPLERFRAALTERHRLLSELRQLGAAEVDL